MRPAERFGNAALLRNRFDTMQLFKRGIKAQHYPQMILSRVLSSYRVETATPLDAYKKNTAISNNANIKYIVFFLTSTF